MFEERLKSTQKDLICLRQITQLLELLREQSSKDEQDSKIYFTQINLLNKMLGMFKNQRNLKLPLLQALKQHVSCLFELNLAELKQNSKGVETQCR